MSNSGTPLVSICLPVFNGEKFLSAAIESALAQTFSDFELIIVDDCSTDGSQIIIERFATQDKRIVHFRNTQNRGLFANYNECIERAKGKYVKPYAQDDLWDPRLLERMTQEYERQSNIALMAVAREWIGESSEVLEVHRHFDENKRVVGKTQIAASLMEFKNSIGEPSAVMFPRAIAGSGFDSSYHHLGDLEYWLRLLRAGDYYYVNEPLCRFRRHSESTTNKNIESLKFGIDMIRIGDGFEDVLTEQGLEKTEYKMQAVRRVASFVNQTGIAPSNMDEYQQLAYYALLYADRSVTKLEGELFVVNKKLTEVLHSRFWKSGAFVRNVYRRLNRASSEPSSIENRDTSA